MKLLVNGNIPPTTVEFFSENGHNIKTFRDVIVGEKDSEIAKVVEEENSCIITQDTDFGEIYYSSK